MVQAKENADDLLTRKKDMEKEQKEVESLGEQKDELLQKKLKTIGNYVHDSVPISDNEVSFWRALPSRLLTKAMTSGPERAAAEMATRQGSCQDT